MAARCIDGSKGAIPGAAVTVRNTATAVTRETVTDAQGLFVFTNLFAGTYDLRVTLTGFRTYEQKSIVLTATERVAVPPIVLEVGGLEEVVTVEASTLRAQAQSGERSGTIRADEIKDTQLRGRDFLGLLQGMPGVVDTNVRNAPGWNAFLGTQINGLSDQFMGMSYDGVSSKDTGFGAANYVTPSLDSIAEVKIQTSNYQAEYGRAGGANIIVVTKSGSAQFSGSAAYFKRHEGLNTNSWDRRRTCDATGGTSPLCATPRYRYDNSAFTLGGPVLVPGTTFNQKRDKLFFFYSLDLLPRTDPFLVSSTVPSALERNGDFSRTVNNAGVLRNIRNPFSGLPCNVNTGGAGCFPGNVIPQGMIHPMGRQIMNLFPLPDPALVGNPVTQGNYNYQFAGDTEKLRRDNVVRVDWNVRPRHDVLYPRAGGQGSLRPRPVQRDRTGADCRRRHGVPVVGRQLRHQHHGLCGHAHAHVHGLDRARGHRRDQLGDPGRVSVGTIRLGCPRLSQSPAGSPPVLHGEQSESHPAGHHVHAGRGGANALPNTRNINIGQGQSFPWLASNDTHNLSVNLTHLRGKHNLKTGFFYERTGRPGAAVEQRRHLQLQLGRGQSARHQSRLGERAARAPQHLHREQQQHPLAAAVQPAGVLRPGQLARDPAADARSRRPLLLHRRGLREGSGDRLVRSGRLESSGGGEALAAALCQRRVPVYWREPRGVNPLTGEQRASPWIGAVVSGSGDINNGTVFGRELPDTYPSPGIRTAPRLGFGWDVFGDGKTAVRGGFGTSYNRLGDGQYGGFTGVISRTVSLQWTTIDDRFNAPSLENPLGGTIVQDETRPITVHSWSIGVQRELPWRLLADVAYVGNTVRNAFAVNAGQSYTNQLNDPDPRLLANPTPDMIDRTTGNVLPTNLIRPNYPGRGGITQRVFLDELYRNYNAIQVEVRRRLYGGLAWAVNYTGSVTKQYTGYDWYRPEPENRDRNSHKNGSRPHNLKFTYNWMLPGVSRFMGNNVIAKGVFDGWQLSGISTFLGGTWANFGYNFSGAAPNVTTLTGGLGGSRVVIVCDPNLPRSERTFERQYRTECVRPPGPLTDPSDTLYQGTGIGAGQEDARMGLGYINHDMTLLKNFNLGHGRNLQVRAEAYNVFNTTQYQGVNTTATFDFATGVQTNPAFGSISGVRANSNRVIQLGVRLMF